MPKPKMTQELRDIIDSIPDHSPEEDACIVAAALSDPDNPPLRGDEPVLRWGADCIKDKPYFLQQAQRLRQQRAHKVKEDPTPYDAGHHGAGNDTLDEKD